MKKRNYYLDILIRYFILIIVAIPNLYLFYAIFTPLTLYLSYFLLSLFFNPSISGITILLEGFSIEIIEACVAGSAYYLLLVLNLATPKIELKKRIRMILLSFVALLLLNVIRIFVLSVLLVNQAAFFDITHKVFWYLISTIFVVGIWLYQIKKFKIKEIPFYSDIWFFYKKSIFRKRK